VGLLEGWFEENGGMANTNGERTGALTTVTDTGVGSTIAVDDGSDGGVNVLVVDDMR